MKFFVIAGEASGDLHAANLLRSLSLEDKDASFVGLGGDKMRAAGCDIRVDYRDMAYMGVVAVLANLPKIRRNFRIARAALVETRPAVLILIDYPSFNLRMAAFCRKHLPATRIVYYIPPKVWAWKSWRVHRIARYADDVLGIFPFEPAFYARYGYSCQYVGNPTADCIRTWQQSHQTEEAKEETETENSRTDNQPSVASRYYSPSLRGAGGSPGSFCAVVNIGTNPTVGNTRTTVEAHLLDFSDSLYNKVLTIHFQRFIRPERRFSSLAALTAQIRSDLRTAFPATPD